ncbi:MAG: tripartite tricarboxylate transporter substrate binding protein [Burkholderiales bacterium]|nr:tripartite tricarboxylate transporter substrate binding protein [Burkholderiales bacterium]
MKPMLTRGLAAACLALCANAFAQEYPARQVQVVIPFSAGSASDVMGRLVLDRVAAAMGARFVIDNRPAAGGNVGTAAVTKAAPDGYTLLLSSSGPLAANRTLYPNLGYDPERDLAPIALFASLPNIIVVSAKLPVTTVAELIAHVRGRANVPYGSVGNGSSQHLAGAYFEQIAGVQMTHVPYKVTSQMVSDLVSGEVPVSFQLLPNVIGPVKGGQVRPLAVAAARRLPALPEVPTASEVGVRGYESAAWFAFLAPRGTPRPIIDRLQREIGAALGDAALRARFAELGAEPLAATPEETARFIAAETAKWREIITRAGIKLDP